MSPSAFTAGDWDVFNSASLPFSAKVNRLLERMVAIGLLNPAEETTKHLVAIIVSTPAYANFTGPQLHGMVLEFKQSLATVRRSAVPQHTRMVSFPVRAMDLPSDVYNTAYPDDPPIDASAPNQTGFATRAHRPPPLVSQRDAQQHSRIASACRHAFSDDLSGFFDETSFPTTFPVFSTKPVSRRFSVFSDETGFRRRVSFAGHFWLPARM